MPADFIGFAEPTDDLPTADGTGSMHDLLMTNLFAQTQALAFGKTAEEIAAEGTPPEVVPHKVMPGNRPSHHDPGTKLTPSVLGQLIALYEHQVFVEGTIWGIDSFDQWGVELGKTQAKALLPVITGDDVTRRAVGLLDRRAGAPLPRRARPRRLAADSERDVTPAKQRTVVMNAASRSRVRQWAGYGSGMVLHGPPGIQATPPPGPSLGPRTTRNTG